MNSTSTRAVRFVYRIAFRDSIDMERVEQVLLLAILAVGCLHGAAAVRLDAGYAIDPHERTVAIDGTTEIGRAVTRIFAGFCIHEFGDDAFGIDRAGGAVPVPPRTPRRPLAAAS